MLSANNEKSRNLIYNVLNGNKHGAADGYYKELFADHKIVQVSAMKVHFQIAERSLVYLDPDIQHRRMTYPSEQVLIYFCKHN